MPVFVVIVGQFAYILLTRNENCRCYNRCGIERVISPGRWILHPKLPQKKQGQETGVGAGFYPASGLKSHAGMSINIGLDIGAVSLKLAAIGSTTDEALFRSIGDKSKTFYEAAFPGSSPYAGRPLILSSYRRIQGSPIQSTFDLLQELYEHMPEENVEGIRVTGSGSQLIAKILGIYFENEFRAIAKGVRMFNPEVRTIFEMGGESSKYLRLDPEAKGKHLGIVDYQTSGECAAGTGSFIDQQATRLLYSVEQVGAAACGASCAARIAGRCSVFAKTDMIHAQQKGYTTDQILRGLCDAVARNFKSSIVKGRAVVAPVAFIGGVALNQGVSQRPAGGVQAGREATF